MPRETMSKKMQEGSGSDAAIRIPISVLKADPKNPRKISGEALDGLAISLETFGPLDVVFNEATGELVSGHQRVASLRKAGAVDVVRESGEELGYIVHPKTAARFPVRFVRWDETKQRMANLVANNPHLQGEFDNQAIDQLRALEEEANFAELGRGQYHWKHEPAFMGWVKGHQCPDYGEGKGERTQTTVWEVGSISQAERKEFDHSSPKPVGLFEIPIIKHLKHGEVCYEPFSGSAPQIIAAEMHGRRCFAMELEPKYVDVAVARWEKFTGKTAYREDTHAR